MNEKIGLFLKSDINAFELNDKLYSLIKKSFPGLDIINFDNIDELKNSLKEITYLVTWYFPEKFYKHTKDLKAVFTPAAGHDWVKKDPDNKIKVFYGKFHGKMMAESLLGKILYFNRKINLLIKSQSNKKWDRDLLSDTKMLANQNILIIGYGSIGRECAELLKNFKCKITGLQRKIKSGFDEIGTKLITVNDIENELNISDHIVLILPGDESTRKFFKKKYYKIMKKSAYLYNMGRGNSIDENELIEAVNSGLIAGASLDVFNKEPLDSDSKLWKNDKILLTPHSDCIYSNYYMEFFKELKEGIQNLL